MKIDIKEHPMKMICFGLSKEEGNSQELREFLKSRFKEWNDYGYLPVVYISGDMELEECMYGLMKRNYE